MATKGLNKRTKAMILARQKKLQPRSNICIWCERRFLPNGLNQDRTVNFGPVERTKEHIIPGNIFGGLITLDLCKDCNDRFGSRMDHELTCDERVFMAAKDAGVNIKEYLKRYQSTRRSEDGRTFQSSHYSDGTDYITPKLDNLAALTVGAVDHKTHSSDLRNLRNRLKQKVLKKFKIRVLSQDQEARVTRLMGAIASHPNQVHMDSVLGEHFKPTALLPFEEIQLEGGPCGADWCIAKMLFETTASLMPAPFHGYLEPVQKYLRKFIVDGLASELSDSGTSILQSGNDQRSGLFHTIVITATQTSYEGEVRLFGGGWWRFSDKLTPVKAPPLHGFRLNVLNPFGSQEQEVSVQVTQL